MYCIQINYKGPVNISFTLVHCVISVTLIYIVKVCKSPEETERNWPELNNVLDFKNTFQFDSSGHYMDSIQDSELLLRHSCYFLLNWDWLEWTVKVHPPHILTWLTSQFWGKYKNGENCLTRDVYGSVSQRRLNRN